MDYRPGLRALYVALDRWVRGGGRVLLLADPRLEWPSQAPLGSVLRPPYAFADTGLLGHWGLRLDLPATLGPAERRVAGRTVITVSPGTLVQTGGGCHVDRAGFIARCAIGRGVAIVIADADFINPPSDERDAERAGLDVLMIELAELEH